MSLDVYLYDPGDLSDGSPGGSGIFIRENGAVKEITREEWDIRYPDREPLIVRTGETPGQVYSRNITHNLGKMAGEAGIHDAMWCPDEIGITKAAQLIGMLERGLELLKSNPAHFRQFNPSNGWGDYDGLVDFVEDYLNACRRYPNADVSVSR